MHLQECLTCKRCSASGLNCGYLNPYIKLKLIGLAIRLYQKFWKKRNFSRLVNANENFVNVFLRFRGQSSKKTCLRFAIFSFSEKLQNIFEIGLTNMECSYKNHSHCKNILKEKLFRHNFVVYVLIYPLSKFGGNRTNSLWVFAFYSVCYKWKNWFKKTALNMSIRPVIFTSSQNLKPPFLCQYLILLRILF